ncbi:MAG TPA: LysR family transcriptional regulator [Anaeromyxobacteraceae bacterium]|nr:LysR family transcriptional regulator [Anaeromyxobacteraceae bacterium]
MDLNRLAVFEAVVRTASFSAAASELALAKSSVSRSIARLEADLGVQLLFRTTRRVVPSAAGAALYERVTPLLGEVRSALGELPEGKEEPAGTLRVTAPVDLGELLLAEAVTRYTARYPAASVELHLTGRMVDLVAEGFDVALRAAPSLKDSTLVVRRAAPIVMRLFASPSYLARRGVPRSEAELALHDWVEFRSGPRRGPSRPARPEARGPSPRGRIACDDLLFARHVLRASAGIGLLPTFVAEPDVSQGTLVRVLPHFERRAGYLHLVTPGARHVPHKVKAFRDLVLEVVKARQLGVVS